MNRREFIRAVAATSTVLLTPMFAASQADNNKQSYKAKDKPNVVIIYGDDVGFGDVGAYGAKLIPTPNIDRLAAKVQPGISDALFSQVDLLASFAALLNKKIPTEQAQDSRGLLAVLLGSDMKGPEVILEQTNGSDIAIRRGKWKYVEAKGELYDLSADPSEKTNITTRFPEVAVELETLLKKYKTQPLCVP